MDEKLRKWKQEYEEITPSEPFKKKVNAMLKEKPRRSPAIKAVSGIAAACIICVGALNVSPALAQTVSQLPGMKSVVNVLTFDRFQLDDHGFEADIVTPKIEGMTDTGLEEKLNQELAANAQQIIDEVNAMVEEFKAMYPNEDTHFAIESNYEIKTDSEDYFSFAVYTYLASGSGNVQYKFYTIDKNQDTLVTLPSLFQEGSDYITPISQYILAEIDRQMEAGENVYFTGENGIEGFQKITPDQDFYINQDGNLVICFDEYEIAPGSSGTPEFVIPNTVVEDILK